MSEYGWQIFDDTGALQLDDTATAWRLHTVVMFAGDTNKSVSFPELTGWTIAVQSVPGDLFEGAILNITTDYALGYPRITHTVDWWENSYHKHPVYVFIR